MFGSYSSGVSFSFSHASSNESLIVGYVSKSFKTFKTLEIIGKDFSLFAVPFLSVLYEYN
ncbi:MAG: hypothetical protein GY936_20365 [Ignavibacteriae bacterium]|nr:hypothetical protein [Ignavibacteriota bacterium]